MEKWLGSRELDSRMKLERRTRPGLKERRRGRRPTTGQSGNAWLDLNGEVQTENIARIDKWQWITSRMDMKMDRKAIWLVTGRKLGVHKA